MHQRKSKKIIIYIFLLFILGSINNSYLSKVNFYNVKNIYLFGLGELDRKKLLNKIGKLNLENIFRLNKNEISNLIESIPIIEKYKIFIKYPSTINIQIQKTNFLAKLNYNGEIMLLGSNGKLSKNNLKNHKLPFIFGNPKNRGIS